MLDVLKVLIFFLFDIDAVDLLNKRPELGMRIE
jgi:hypothetical protein